ncbi:N-acetylmuramate alpha-1-phosphate uridylyltransferase MurU [Luteimonas sp. RIT-PG2_3]
MKALIFAAGLGERMRPLTDHTPKPLLVAGGKPLIAWHLEKLAALGVSDVVVNTSWLAAQFPQRLGDGDQWGLRLHYTHEGSTPLETGGGMHNALPLLGDAPFIAINGDIWTDFDLAGLPASPTGDAHLVLIDNPTHHPGGDFELSADGWLASEGSAKLTFSGIGVYRPSLLQDWRDVIGQTPGADATPPRFQLAPLLRAAMRRRAVTGEHHAGAWTDVGTPERLRQLEHALAAPAARDSADASR